jgi:hypothetical protein
MRTFLLSLRGVVNRRRSEGEKGSAVEGEVDGKKAGMDGPGGVPSEFEHFSREVFEDGGEIDCAHHVHGRQERKRQFSFFRSNENECKDAPGAVLLILPRVALRRRRPIRPTGNCECRASRGGGQ